MSGLGDFIISLPWVIIILFFMRDPTIRFIVIAVIVILGIFIATRKGPYDEMQEILDRHMAETKVMMDEMRRAEEEKKRKELLGEDKDNIAN